MTLQLTSLLKEWINPFYLSLENVRTFPQQFLTAKPYPHLVLPTFFIEKKLKEVLSALREENFVLKDADRFTFLQTPDLVSSSNLCIEELRSFLSSSDFVSYLSFLTRLKLRSNVIDMSGTIYQKTHYLLPHDDQLERRKLAYFLYLSDLAQNEGGSLGLYETKSKKPTIITKKIIPQFNMFAFFEVSSKSFHEVDEVIVEKERIALTGWFHGN